VTIETKTLKSVAEELLESVLRRAEKMGLDTSKLKREIRDGNSPTLFQFAVMADHNNIGKSLTEKALSKLPIKTTQRQGRRLTGELKNSIVYETIESDRTRTGEKVGSLITSRDYKSQGRGVDAETFGKSAKAIRYRYAVGVAAIRWQ